MVNYIASLAIVKFDIEQAFNHVKDNLNEFLWFVLIVFDDWKEILIDLSFFRIRRLHKEGGSVLEAGFGFDDINSKIGVFLSF